MDDQTKIIMEKSVQLTDCLKVVEGLKEDSVDLKKKVVALEEHMENVEQYSRSRSATGACTRL